MGGIELIRLLVGTVVYRPYVYAFFACFLLFSLRHLRARDTLVYLALAYLLAFAAEYSSTRNGFPFGMYVYVEDSRSRELWISNVPFWDSLSFVFLSYFSWLSAAALLRPAAPSRALLSPAATLLAGALMMLLDVVIDPVTLLGDRWFLGRIYYYPGGGAYFGVTLRNFCGWFALGAVTVLAFQTLARLGWVSTRRWHRLSTGRSLAALAVYASIFLFNLSITVWLGEWRLFAASATLVGVVLLLCWVRVATVLRLWEGMP